MGTVMLFGLAVPVIELIIGVVALIAILGMFGVAMWLVFRLQPTLENVGYPVKVPGWKTRMAEPPPFKSDLKDVSRQLALLMKHAVAKGYKKRDVKKTLNTSLVRWIKADPQFEGKRAIVDPWNRRVPVLDSKGRPMKDANGQPVTKPMLIAGYHQGKTLYVVFVPEDHIENTAFCHEGGHGIHLIRGITDYDHKDKDMFGKGGIVQLAKSEMRKERTGEDPKEPLPEGIEVEA